MGGTSKSSQTTNQQTSQTHNPWAPTIPGLTDLANKVTGQIGGAGLSGAQTGALNELQTNANQGNPYAPQIGMLANTMLEGGPDRTGYATGGYDAYKASLDPIARGDFVDPSQNPALQGYLSTIGNDISNRVNGMFAGAGRDMSGAHVNSLSRGLTEGMAPTMLNAYQGERQNQLHAMDQLYGAGNNTAGVLSNLDQTKLGNQQAGISVAGSALGANDYGANQTLAIEAQRLGIPLEQYSQIAGILGPLGQMGGTSTGTMSGQTQGTFTKSPVDTAMGWANFAKTAMPIGGQFLNMFK